MPGQILLTKNQVEQCILSLAESIIQKFPDPEKIIFAGIQRGGAHIGSLIVDYIQKKYPQKKIRYAQLDVTFYRDDIRREILRPDVMNMPYPVENNIIILIDDVLFTGRTIKAALDALLDYGRPERVELCVLIDRAEHRQLPIQADYVGKKIPSQRTDKIKLIDGEVVLIPAENRETVA
ncbi:MAG: bifunctional pyr operon transcriptional regulator/uracil phosphoribosyltransferase PyrR [Chitinophagaceae bacterium]|nr:bifunctional pyr operon transcriptional regulator/uracil phosphoribosyltransferase PyrR [Chitinophagaceae bacterium]